MQASSFLSKFDRVKGYSYQRPDPSFDAWMCLRGDQRISFDCRKFITTYPSIKDKIKELRERLGIRLMKTEDSTEAYVLFRTILYLLKVNNILVSFYFVTTCSFLYLSMWYDLHYFRMIQICFDTLVW